VIETETKTYAVTLRYFAWLREKIGVSEEVVALPSEVEAFAAAFGASGVIRVALDRTHAKADAALGAAREIAFFPPVTGG
jgi:sulfur-carrier protein